jgi:DNA-binding response OmpR family regulator
MSTTVLVIEDDLEINELLGEYLALEKIRYLKATTGEAGVYLARLEKPDAVILDLMLPDIDGYEVARRITGSRASFDVPVVMLTCMCQEADREKGYGAGALYFMNKPFLPDDLLATVRQAMAWKASLRAGAPVGMAWLGGKEPMACSKAINQMVADLFARTELDDAAVGNIRLAMEKISEWAKEWGQKHEGVGNRVKVEYRIGEGGDGGGAVEWILSEEVPGMLAETFFKDAERKDAAAKDSTGKDGTTKGGSGGRIRGLLGWVTVFLKKENGTEEGNNEAAKWEEIMQLTGASQFERDVRRQSVRMVRCAVPVEAVGAG